MGIEHGPDLVADPSCYVLYLVIGLRQSTAHYFQRQLWLEPGPNRVSFYCSDVGVLDCKYAISDADEIASPGNEVDESKSRVLATKRVSNFRALLLAETIDLGR